MATKQTNVQNFENKAALRMRFFEKEKSQYKVCLKKSVSNIGHGKTNKL